MNKLIKSIIAIGGVLIIIVSPQTTAFETTSYSVKGAFGTMSGTNGNLYLEVYASEETTSSKSNKTATAGIQVSGTFYQGSECWNAIGFGDITQFNAVKGPVIPKQVIASGTISVKWYDSCSTPVRSFSDTVTVYLNMTAIRDQADTNSGAITADRSTFKQISNFDQSDAPASAVASVITSQMYGSVYPTFGYVGERKSHETLITR